MASVVTMEIGDCKITSVTVFRDRAEIQRSVRFASHVDTLKESGEVEMKIVGLTHCANVDSIRVKSDPGDVSRCQILEVGCEFVSPSAGDGENSTNKSMITGMREEVECLNRDLVALANKIRLVEKQRSAAQLFVDSAFGKKEDAKGPTLTDVREIMDFYEEKMSSLDEKEAALTLQQKSLRTELESKEFELRKLVDSSVVAAYTSERKRCITVVLKLPQPVESEECCLILSYVVTSASWAPSYDVRVDTADNTMALQYFAEVTQKSGEDWDDCDLQLSTSNPAVGSNPPQLPQRMVDYFPYGYKNFNSRGRTNARNAGGDDYSDAASISMIEDRLGGGFGEDNVGGGDHGGNGGGGLIDVKGSGDAGSTTFSVARRVSIAGDSKSHKVTVAMVVFVPQLVHYVAPSVSAFVYLQAKALNNSSYPLLPCDDNKVAVFLDGSFVANSRIKQTCSSGESFSIFLGVDPAVKVDYLPCRTENRSKGWLSGMEQSKYFYSTVVHNTKKVPVKIIVAEVLPQSTSDKVTVELIEPAPTALTKPSEAKSSTSAISSSQDILNNLEVFAVNPEAEGGSRAASSQSQGQGTAPPPLPRDFVHLNKHNNNVVWLKTVKAGQKTEVKFTYRLVWPQEGTVDVVTY